MMTPGAYRRIRRRLEEQVRGIEEAGGTGAEAYVRVGRPDDQIVDTMPTGMNVRGEQEGRVSKRRWVMPMPFTLLAVLGVLAALVVVLAGFFLTRRWL